MKAPATKVHWTRTGSRTACGNGPLDHQGFVIHAAADMSTTRRRVNCLDCLKRIARFEATFHQKL